MRAFWAIFCAAVAFAAYTLTLPPSYAFWDTGEMQTVASILGIAHPPGSPAFVVLGWTFAHALPFENPAWRVDAMCAAAVASAVGVLYALQRRFDVPPFVATLATMAFAFSVPVWRFATNTEVHDLALAFSALALYFAVAFAQGGRRRDLFGASLAFGLLAATHGVAVFLAPALAIALGSRRELRSWAAARVVTGGIALGLSPYAYVPYGLSPYAYVPFRSAFVVAHGLDPTVALGLPPGLAFWNYGNPSSPLRFWRFVTASEFRIGSGFAGYLDPSTYVRDAGALVGALGSAYGLVATLVATVGALLLIVRCGPPGIAIVTAAVITVPYIESYADLQVPERYFLLALWCGALAIGVAFERIANLFDQPRLGIVRSALAIALAVTIVAAHPDRSQLFQQRSDDGAPSYVAYVKSVTPDDAVILADWAYSTPLAYASYVLHDLGARIVVPASAEQYAAYFDGWLARGRRVYFVSFDDDLSVRDHSVARVSFGRSYNVYRLVR